MNTACRVYLITNTVNGKKYVGWTDGTFQERWKKHCNLAGLTNPKQLPILHKAIRKYGKAAFSMTLICEAENPEEARKKEMHFIAEYRTFYKWTDAHGYNMTLGGEGAVGYRHTVEGLRKISEKSRNRWGDEKWASAWRARHKQNPPIRPGTKRPDFGAKMRGRKRPGMHTSETKQRLADLFSGSFMILLPTGERELVRNLKKYCREHGLNDGHMHSCSRGERKSHKGHFVYNLDRLGLAPAEALATDFEKLEVLRRPERYEVEPETGNTVAKGAKPSTRRTFIVTAPDRSEYRVEDLKRFCEERGLPFRSTYRLARGGRRRLRSGWLCRYADNDVREWQSKARVTGSRCPEFQSLSESQQRALTSRESLERMYLKEGLSVQAIADRFGVGRWFVRSQMTKHEIPLRKRRN